MILKDKKILFFAPKFFGYELDIKNKLEELGAKIDFFDERPSNSPIKKALLRLKPSLIKKITNEYYKEIIIKTAKIKYDFVFVLNIEAMPIEYLKTLKSFNESACFILYMWDSIRNRKNTPQYLNFFDRVFSFDKKDSIEFDNVHFKPLFYNDEYKSISKCDFLYDLTFIGTAHTDRLNVCKKLVDSLKHMDRSKIFMYNFLHSRMQFFYYKLFNKSFKSFKLSDFNYNPLSKQEVLRIVSCSRIILDIQHPYQTGLTIRTIEMLGARKKIITTNSDIVNYDFYNSNNIAIIDRKKPYVPNSFLESSYKEIDHSIYTSYSLESWLIYIFTTPI